MLIKTHDSNFYLQYNECSFEIAKCYNEWWVFAFRMANPETRYSLMYGTEEKCRDGLRRLLINAQDVILPCEA